MTALPKDNFQRWQDNLVSLIKVKNNVQWAIGDLWNDGCEMFGDDVWQALDHTKISPDTIRNYALVCRKFPSGTRRYDLSFSHYDAVKGLDEITAHTWLKKAVDNEWSRTELRNAITGNPGKNDFTTCKLGNLMQVLADYNIDTTRAATVTIRGNTITIRIEESD